MPGLLTLVLRCGDEEGAAGELLSVNNVGESQILTSDLFLTAAFGKVAFFIITIINFYQFLADVIIFNFRTRMEM